MREGGSTRSRITSQFRNAANEICKRKQATDDDERVDCRSYCNDDDEEKDNSGRDDNSKNDYDDDGDDNHGD